MQTLKPWLSTVMVFQQLQGWLQPTWGMTTLLQGKDNLRLGCPIPHQPSLFETSGLRKGASRSLATNYTQCLQAQCTTAGQEQHSGWVPDNQLVHIRANKKSKTVLKTLWILLQNFPQAPGEGLTSEKTRCEMGLDMKHQGKKSQTILFKDTAIYYQLRLPIWK